VSGVGDTAHSFYLSHEEWWGEGEGLKELSHTVRRYMLSLTINTEQSPSSEAASSSARRDTPCIFFGTRKSITVFTRARHLSLFLCVIIYEIIVLLCACASWPGRIVTQKTSSAVTMETGVTQSACCM